MFAARKKKLITARAYKHNRTARLLTNARKDHSIPLVDTLTSVEVSVRLLASAGEYNHTL